MQNLREMQAEPLIESQRRQRPGRRTACALAIGWACASALAAPEEAERKGAPWPEARTVDAAMLDADEPTGAGIPTTPSPALAATERWLAATEVREVAMLELARTMVKYGCRIEMRGAQLTDLGMVIGKAPVELEARALPEPPRPSQQMSIWVDVRQKNRAVRSILVPIEVRAFQKAWTATRDLPAGTPLTPEDLKLTEVDVAATGQLAWQGDPDNQVLRSRVIAGRYVTWSQVAEPESSFEPERALADAGGTQHHAYRVADARRIGR